MHEKYFCDPNRVEGAKIGPEFVFIYFLKFDSLVFIEIVYNDSLH